MLPDFAPQVLKWYAQFGRDLPWRNHPDPYAVWVSEIMLQQTRVDTVLPYFARWMQAFPTIAALAESDLQQVLAVWEGLGYYSRARNLQRAAQIVMQQYGGNLPKNVTDLRKLPGIGRYTAGAIASMAFGADEAALDGNICRVLARVFDVDDPCRSPAGERRLWELAESHLPRGCAAEYNQALMDLGATVCTPRDPLCSRCPLAGLCRARALGIEAQRPVRRVKAIVPHYVVVAAVLGAADGRVLIARRPEDGLLGGLWEFPGGKVKPNETLPAALQREIREELMAEIEVGAPVGVYRHAFTHFKITLHAFRATLLNGTQPQALEHSALAWVHPHECANYPMGKVDRLIAEHLVEAVISDE